MRLLNSFFLLFLIACAVVPPQEIPKEKPESEFLKNPSFCNVDADCTCGGIDTNTDDCFVGNKLYSSKYVDLSRDCPDFCTGIAAHLETRCMENVCQNVPREGWNQPVACTEEAKLCPDGTAVGRVGPDCEFAPCPEVPRKEPPVQPPSAELYDPSAWHWQCEDGTWAATPESCFENKCLSQSDCQLIGVKDICGPYKIAAPKTMHKPPVFYEYRCGAEQCSVVMAACPPPDELHPLITNVDCMNSKCITLPVKKECETAADCTMNSCCHPTGCVPVTAKPNCAAVMCTADCQPSTLDCGGSCGCVDGMCVGQNYWG